MLINCPECNKQISDKAIACPNCGYPINLPPAKEKPSKSSYRRSKFHKLPNGFGTIRKLSGNRRKPYAVYPPVTEWKDNGSPVRRKALGYFATYNDAYLCLSEYNKNPYDIDSRSLTFADIHEMYYNEKYVNNTKRKYSDASKYSAKCAFNNLKDLHSMKMRDIKASDVQRVLDNCKHKHATLEIMHMCFKEVSKFALKNDYIEKDYSPFVQIKIADDDEKGVPFSEDELKILWKNRNDKTVQIILILICTGFRISELEKVKYLKDKQCFVGGIKTRAGKDRIVPIHNVILPYIDNIEGFNAQRFRAEKFNPKLVELGIKKSNKNTDHTPHDCRHTFSWAWDKYVKPTDDFAKHLVMGHSLGTDVEKTVYGHRTESELLTCVNQLYGDIFVEKKIN